MTSAPPDQPGRTGRPRPAGGPAVEVDQLTIRYGDVIAVADLSFSARPGEVTALLGPNGAGKTSTVEALEGYRRPAGGTARVLGLDPVTDRRQLVRRVGVMLQEGGVYTGIRPHEALRLFSSYYDDPLDPDALLVRVGLEHRRRASWRTLSGGERQRLSLALALVGQPEVVFLDEPSAGIDPLGRQLVRQLVGDLRDDGVAVVLTTHDLDEAERLADHVVIIDHGRLLAEGPPAELVRPGGDGDGPLELRFAAAPGIDLASLADAVGAPATEVSAGEYLVATAPTPEAVAALAAWLAQHDLPLADLRAGRQRLEDVFLRLTADAATEAAAGPSGDGGSGGEGGGDGGSVPAEGRRRPSPGRRRRRGARP